MARTPPLDRLPSPLVGVHLDLKGVAPRRDYLPELLDDLAGQGINTILVEYEDVFPFEGIDVCADRAARWSRAQLDRFLDAAAQRRLLVIPLQQCLGHLEYVLRWPRYRRMSEEAAYPGTLKLSSPAGRQLVFRMLDQVMAAHPRSPLVHLGMDEAHSLVNAPRYRGRNVLGVFLRHLGDLCERVEAAGKTPVIWSDMLEDHFDPDQLRPFRDRVILMPWDYTARGPKVRECRLLGRRISRRWLEQPDHPDAPEISTGQKFIEDLPARVGRLIKPHVNADGSMKSLFQVDLWSRLGFRVIGGAHVRRSGYRPLLPDYLHVRDNVRLWARRISQSRQLGVIATSWARGTTFCPPDTMPETAWPGIIEFAQAMRRRPRTFWPGLRRDETDRLWQQVGRCRQGWRIEQDLADQMRRCGAKLRAHRFEWKAIELMLRVLYLHRRSDYALQEMIYFRSGVRLPPAQWQRRLKEQTQLISKLSALRRQVDRHFSQRYHGQAYRQWLADVFDGPIDDLRAQQPIARRKEKLARAWEADARRRGSD